MVFCAWLLSLVFKIYSQSCDSVSMVFIAEQWLNHILSHLSLSGQLVALKHLCGHHSHSGCGSPGAVRGYVSEQKVTQKVQRPVCPGERQLLEQGNCCGVKR